MLFPVLMMLVLGAWVLSFTHVITTSDEMHEAMLDINTRGKEMSDADIEATTTPSPIDANGSITNSGMLTLTDLRLYSISGGGITEETIESTLAHDMAASYSLGSVAYGDHLLVVSDQDFWGIEVVPVELRSDVVLKQWVEGSQVTMTQIYQPPTKAYLPLGAENATLKEDISVLSDNKTVRFSKQDDRAYDWYVGSCTHSPSSQLTIWGRKTGGKNPIADIEAWDGEQYEVAYTCEWTSTSFTPCTSENLADELKEDAGYMKVRVIPDRASDEMDSDYVFLDAVCIL